MSDDAHKDAYGHSYDHKHCSCGTGYCKTCMSSCPSCGSSK